MKRGFKLWIGIILGMVVVPGWEYTVSGNLTHVGIQALQAGNYGIATTDFYQALSAASSGTNDYDCAEYYLARSYTELGNSSTAQVFVTALLSENPAGGYQDGAWYYQMRIALSQNNFTLLSTSFTQLTTFYPQAKQMPSAYLRYAEGLRLINHDYRTALYYDQQILSEYSTDFVAGLGLLDMGMVYWSRYTVDYDTTQLVLSEQIFNQCLSRYATDAHVVPKAYHWLGYVQEYGNNNYLSAIANYQHVLNQWPTYSNCSNVLFELARSYDYSQNNTKAITTYQQYITQYPANTVMIQVIRQRLAVLEMNAKE